MNELESEGHVISGVGLLREQAETALRNRDVQLLLNNARVRLKEEEFPLALQKLQSALELDPQNAEALAMKSEIDNRLHEKQLDNLFRVAREYLDQQLFAQARVAVEEILEINASNTSARNLLVRIEQAKQDFERTVAKHDALYDAALLSYDRGELNNAQGQVEQLFDSLRRKPVKVDAKRDSEYNNLYQRIVADLEALDKALSDARHKLAAGDFTGALSICNRYLETRPNDPAFQTLKLEAEDALREQRAAAIADFVRKAEAEPDLDRKDEILRDAIALYPDESYFQQALSMVRNRRNLISSIVERARRCEEDLHFSEALSQWEMLRNVAPQYEGIDRELRRLHERRGDQAREQAKNRWIDKFNRYFLVDDYAKSQDVIREALAEFPGDSKLQELHERAGQHILRSSQSKTLLEQTNKLFAQKDYEGALEALKSVAAFAEQSPSIRVSLLSVLLDHARTLLNSNWKTAQPFIELAMQVDSGDPVARNLSTTLEDHKRKAAVERYISEATELRESGSLSAALSRVEQALATFPNELRLSQLHNLLRSELYVADQTAVSNQPKAKRKGGKWFGLGGALAINKPKPNPKPSRGRLKTLAASAGAGAGQPFPPHPGAPPAAQAVLTNPVGTKVGESTPSLIPTAPLPSPARNRGMRSLAWIVAGFALLGILLALLLHRQSSPAAQKTNRKLVGSPASSVRFEANIPEVKMMVDGKPVDASTVTLSAGVHQAEASKAGYQSQSKTFTISADHPGQKIVFTLVPLPAQLRLKSDLPEGALALDSGPSIPLRSGLTDHEIPLGTHKVTLLSGNKKVLSFSAEVTKDSPVRLSDLSKETPAVIVSSLGNTSTLYTNASWSLRLGDGSNRNIPASGLPLSDLAKSNNQVIVDNGPNQTPLIVDSEQSPVVGINLIDKSIAAPSNGLILVKANVPDASVLVNKSSLKRPMVNGSKSITLPPGDYSISLAKAGFVDTPPQNVHLTQGEVKVVPFTLSPIETKSQLQITALPSGTEVYIDGNQAGIAKADGVFATQVQPGNHSISLQNKGFDNAPSTRDFKANETTTINAGNLLTELGTLTIENKPANSEPVSVRREGDSQARTFDATGSISLPPGRYNVTMKAKELPAHQVAVTISAGATAVVMWNPGAAQPATTVSPALLLAKAVDNPSSWRLGSAGWWIHQGQDYGWLRAKSGNISIDILKQTVKTLFVTRSKKVEFAVDYRDAADEIDYVLDDHTLRRRVIFAGSTRR